MSTVTSPAKRAPLSPAVDKMNSLPSPATFDFLPALYSLLSRLVLSTSSAEPALEPQQLATEASSLKIRIQRARGAVDALPEMDRTIEEQEVEKAELLRKIRRQHEILNGLSGRMSESLDEGSKMDLDHS
ncbi:MAG: hypothetical protein M1825_005669 [Sarcosagium campestre]|nr:MAG: hypothetical protein M1825_005669 [Sarcosagium campestre]